MVIGMVINCKIKSWSSYVICSEQIKFVIELSYPYNMVRCDILYIVLKVCTGIIYMSSKCHSILRNCEYELELFCSNEQLNVYTSAKL